MSVNQEISQEEINRVSALLRETIDIVNQAIEKEITLFEKEAVYKAPLEYKNDITADFWKLRKELSAIFTEELSNSGRYIALRMRKIKPDIHTIESDLGAIYKEEIAAGCARVKCSAKEIQEIAKAYIIKKYIAIPKLREYSIFVTDVIQLLDKNDTEIIHIIDDTKKTIGTTFLGIGDDLRRKVVKLLTQASGQLKSGTLSLYGVNEELITIEQGMKENSISAHDITVALARIKKEMQVFQRHRRVDGTIDQGIGGNILQILNDKALQRAITNKNKELAEQGKPKIVLQDYITSVQQLISQAEHYIKSIDTYATSDELKRLYEVLPTRVIIDKPFVFPPRKPPPQSIPPTGDQQKPKRKPRTGKVPEWKEGMPASAPTPRRPREGIVPPFDDQSAKPSNTQSDIAPIPRSDIPLPSLKSLQ